MHTNAKGDYQLTLTAFGVEKCQRLEGGCALMNEGWELSVLQTLFYMNKSIRAMEYYEAKYFGKDWCDVRKNQFR